MEGNISKSRKLYYSISEVADMLGVNASLIRFWENEIPTLKPQTIKGTNIRRYVEKDIEHLKVVYNLVKVRGFKISAAKKMLNANREGVDKRAEVLEKLACVRDELIEVKKQLEYLT
ncbi:MAG TPA: MerR family transcriptional regulator [Xylanibacter oryzae]|nr:MerR family transcriptional regulator [Xylanibacter oryzae]MBP7358415.1 MerR family transcriptional regulator [Prevotella sp.]HRN15910.1 MerR family transcriptional regulator [Xylanibacter oryzae]